MHFPPRIRSLYLFKTVDEMNFILFRMFNQVQTHCKLGVLKYKVLNSPHYVRIVYVPYSGFSELIYILNINITTINVKL
jgi:hypothetical protein